MGLFDSLAAGLRSEFGQAAEAEIAAVLPVALQAAGLGSLQNVVNQLQQAGLGQQVQSWANGQPTPVSADELRSILNIDQIKQLAQHFGIDPEAVLSLLSQYLPGVIATAAQKGMISTDN